MIRAKSKAFRKTYNFLRLCVATTDVGSKLST